MDKPKFVYVNYIATTPEKLWRALTSGEFTSQYFAGRRIESEWRRGSSVRMLKEDGTVDWRGEVLEVDPPKLLSYTFDVLDDPNKRDHTGKRVELSRRERPSRVRFEIEQFMDQVKLTLTHDGFEPDGKLFEGISRGWPAILSGLKSLLESGKVLFPDWK